MAERPHVVNEERAPNALARRAHRFRIATATRPGEHLTPRRWPAVDPHERLRTEERTVDERVAACDPIDLTLCEGPEVDEPGAAGQRFRQPGLGEKPCRPGQDHLPGPIRAVDPGLDRHDQGVATTLNLVDEEWLLAIDEPAGVGAGVPQVGSVIERSRNC